MPLYEVTEEGADKSRLIEASTPAAALRFAARSRFGVRAITNPAEAATIASGGVMIEKVSEEKPSE